MPQSQARRRAAQRPNPRRASRGAAVAGRLVYLDTSAYVKLPLQEAEETALREELSGWDGYVSSALLGVESIRACARYGPAYAKLARAWLEGVAMLPLDDEILDSAAALTPDSLRSLDALHLATALSVQEDIGVFVAYDQRLVEAAGNCGFNVASPKGTA